MLSTSILLSGTYLIKRLINYPVQCSMVPRMCQLGLAVLWDVDRQQLFTFCQYSIYTVFGEDLREI